MTGRNCQTARVVPDHPLAAAIKSVHSCVYVQASTGGSTRDAHGAHEPGVVRACSRSPGGGQRQLFDRLDKAIDDRDLGWVPRLLPGYFGFQRRGGYHCAGVDIRRERSFAVRGTIGRFRGNVSVTYEAGLPSTRPLAASAVGDRGRRFGGWDYFPTRQNG